MVTARQSRLIIATGIVEVTVGAALMWLVEYASLGRGTESLFEGFNFAVVLAFVLTFGGMLSLLVGGICFARRGSLGHTLLFSLSLAAVAGLLMFLFDFNVHSWNMLLAMALECTELITAIVLIVALVVRFRSRPS